MATSATRLYLKKPKTKRRGIHSKNSASTNKGSKNYKKLYVGQGR